MIRKIDASGLKFTKFDDSVFKQITKVRHDIVGAKFSKYKILFVIEVVASLISLFAFSTDVDLTIFSLVLYFGTILLGVVPLKFLGVIIFTFNLLMIVVYPAYFGCAVTIIPVTRYFWLLHNIKRLHYKYLGVVCVGYIEEGENNLKTVVYYGDCYMKVKDKIGDFFSCSGNGVLYKVPSCFGFSRYIVEL